MHLQLAQLHRWRAGRQPDLDKPAGSKPQLRMSYRQRACAEEGIEAAWRAAGQPRGGPPGTAQCGARGGGSPAAAQHTALSCAAPEHTGHTAEFQASPAGLVPGLRRPAGGHKLDGLPRRGGPGGVAARASGLWMHQELDGAARGHPVARCRRNQPHSGGVAEVQHRGCCSREAGWVGVGKCVWGKGISWSKQGCLVAGDGTRSAPGRRGWVHFSPRLLPGSGRTPERCTPRRLRQHLTRAIAATLQPHAGGSVAVGESCQLSVAALRARAATLGRKQRARHRLARRRIGLCSSRPGGWGVGLGGGGPCLAG